MKLSDGLDGKQTLEMFSRLKDQFLQELSDYENMVDDQLLEPDYYIDRAEPAEFVPDPEGCDKATLLRDREELLDFDAEVEPLLQVIIGKTLEQSKIEVIEEYEQYLLGQHRAEYKRLRESELILTQKQEAKYLRTMEESDRRIE